MRDELDDHLEDCCSLSNEYRRSSLIGWGSGRGYGGGSQREEGTFGQEKPGSNRDLIAEFKDSNGGKLDEVRQTQDLATNSLGCLAGEESVDVQLRPAGEVAVQVDS